MVENTMEMNTSGAIIPEVYDEMGIIAADTKVIGDIETKGHLTVMGYVQGNINAKGNVIIAGKIDGNIKCNNFYVEAGVLETNVEATGSILVKDDVTLKGSINCKDITITGTVLGDITASGKVGLASTAVVKGNIKAGSMGMELGAKLEGFIAIV